MNGERGVCDICKSKKTKIYYRLRELFRESWHCQRCGHYTIYEEGKELQSVVIDITHDNERNLT